MNASKLRKRLTDAASGQELVRITRTIRGTHPLEGFPLGVGRRWLLLHLASHDMFLDGHTAIRMSDLETVKPWDGPDGFHARGLQHFGQEPQAPAGTLDLGSTRALLPTAAAIAPLITIHVEKKHPNECYIGKAMGASGKALVLHEITPAAEWKKYLTKWPFRDITRVEFGGRYEQALHAIGGDPPQLD